VTYTRFLITTETTSIPPQQPSSAWVYEASISAIPRPPTPIWPPWASKGACCTGSRATAGRWRRKRPVWKRTGSATSSASCASVSSAS
jgi:hypothetical protein